jgi:hypothetical protein
MKNRSIYITLAKCPSSINFVVCQKDVADNIDGPSDQKCNDEAKCYDPVIPLIAGCGYSTTIMIGKWQVAI